MTEDKKEFELRILGLLKEKLKDNYSRFEKLGQ